MANFATRLPPVTAALVLETTTLEMLREHNGAEWCNANGLGAIRRKLGAMTRKRKNQSSVEKARDGARALLHEVCRVCPHGACGMKSWG